MLKNLKYLILGIIFWSLHAILDAVMDATLFYQIVPWYGDMVLWHILKPFEIFSALAAGACLWMITIQIWGARDIAKKIRVIIVGFNFFIFMLHRYCLFESLLDLFREWE